MHETGAGHIICIFGGHEHDIDMLCTAEWDQYCNCDNSSRILIQVFAGSRCHSFKFRVYVEHFRNIISFSMHFVFHQRQDQNLICYAEPLQSKKKENIEQYLATLVRTLFVFRAFDYYESWFPSKHFWCTCTMHMTAQQQHTCSAVIWV